MCAVPVSLLLNHPVLGSNSSRGSGQTPNLKWRVSPIIPPLAQFFPFILSPLHCLPFSGLLAGVQLLGGK